MLDQSCLKDLKRCTFAQKHGFSPVKDLIKSTELNLAIDLEVPYHFLGILLMNTLSH